MTHSTTVVSLKKHRSPRSGIALALASVLAMQSGQAVAKLGFELADPIVLTTLRFGLAAIVLFIIFRHSLPSKLSECWPSVLVGAPLAGTNLFMYESAARVPLGLAVAIQFMGALAVAVIWARSRRQILWIAFAIAGVLVINYSPVDAPISGAGVGFAVASAACWAAYIVFAARASTNDSGGGPVTMATIWAAIITLPLVGLFGSIQNISPLVIVTGLVIAALCSIFANSMEIQSLQRIPVSTFGVLVSLEPVIAALVALLVLDEHLTVPQWMAVLLIVVASGGAAVDSHQSIRDPQTCTRHVT